MTRPRREFSREFKLEAVRLIQAGRPLAQVARELEIQADRDDSTRSLDMMYKFRNHLTVALPG